MTPESNSSALSHDAAHNAGNNAAATIDTRAAGNVSNAALAATKIAVDVTHDEAKNTTPVSPAAEPSTPEKKSKEIPVLSTLSRGWDKVTGAARNVTPAGIINNTSRIIFGLKIVADGFGILSGLGVFYKGASPEAKAKARSPMRIAANVVSLIMLIPGVYFKEKPDSKEQEEEYKKMGIGEYIITKMKHSLDPKNHPVEFAALGTIANGILTVMSGRSQSVKGAVSKEVEQGLFTIAAGSALGLIPNRERAWQISTAIFFARIPTKYKQAHQAYYEGLPAKGVPKGDIFQMGNFVLQQISNALSIFYAGVKKLPDGTIVHLGKKGEKSEDVEAATVTTKNPKERHVDDIADPVMIMSESTAPPEAASLADSAATTAIPEKTAPGFAGKFEPRTQLPVRNTATHAERAELSQADPTAALSI